MSDRRAKTLITVAQQKRAFIAAMREASRPCKAWRGQQISTEKRDKKHVSEKGKQAIKLLRVAIKCIRDGDDEQAGNLMWLACRHMKA